MAKDPAFLFYSSDFLAGVQDLTMEERGQYITLLCLQHQKGHLSEKMIGLSVGNAAADVRLKFGKDPAGLWYNARLDVEIEKRKFFTVKQSERAKEGWKTRKEKIQTSPGNAPAMPVVNVNEDDIINTSKELCKIFGKEFLDPKERMPAEANWYVTIEGQAKEILTVMKPDDAASQIQAYVRYCGSKDRKLIGKNYKAAETILSSNWLELLGEKKARAPDYILNAEVDMQNLTSEAWLDMYKWQMKNDEAFKKHFNGKLSPSQSVGINGKR